MAFGCFDDVPDHRHGRTRFWDAYGWVLAVKDESACWNGHQCHPQSDERQRRRNDGSRRSLFRPTMTTITIFQIMTLISLQVARLQQLLHFLCLMLLLTVRFIMKSAEKLFKHRRIDRLLSLERIWKRASTLCWVYLMDILRVRARRSGPVWCRDLINGASATRRSTPLHYFPTHPLDGKL